MGQCASKPARGEYDIKVHRKNISTYRGEISDEDDDDVAYLPLMAHVDGGKKRVFLSPLSMNKFSTGDYFRSPRVKDGALFVMGRTGTDSKYYPAKQLRIYCVYTGRPGDSKRYCFTFFSKSNNRTVAQGELPDATAAAVEKMTAAVWWRSILRAPSYRRRDARPGEPVSEPNDWYVVVAEPHNTSSRSPVIAVWRNKETPPKDTPDVLKHNLQHVRGLFIQLSRN